MLSRLKLNHSKKYQPAPRIGHATAVIGDRMYLWGGWHKSIPKIHSNSEKLKVLSIVEVFSLRTGEWGQIPTSGLPPLGVAYHACAAVGDVLYYFGGRCGHGGCHHNTVYSLSTVTMKWKDMTPSAANATNSPMKKAQCGMIAFQWRNEDHLFVFGGYGVLPQSHQPEATYIPKRGKPEYGWTNETHIFSIQSKSWIIPQVTGESPQPCSNLSMTSIDSNRAVVFGGFQAEGGRNNDVYVAELRKETLHWSKICQSSNPESVWPCGLCDHALCFVDGLFADQKSSPCVVVVGGENYEGKTLSDCWILNLQNARWSLVHLPQAVAGRQYHSMSTFTLGPHCVWLAVFGGVSDMDDVKDWQDQPMLSDTALIELVKRGDTEWISAVIIDNLTPAGTANEDYLKKLYERVFIGRRDWLRVNKKTTSILPEDEELARAKRAEIRADEAEQEAVEARKKAEAAHILVSEARDDALKERKESISLFGNLSEAKKRVLASEQQAYETKEELQAARQELKCAKAELEDAKQKLEQVREESRHEVQQLRKQLVSLQSCSSLSTLSSASFATNSISSIAIEEDPLFIAPEEVELVNSSSGQICTATYKGITLSAKLVHNVSLEDFKHSVAVISRLRHPNLLLFMGAVIREVPIILYESLPAKCLAQYILEEVPLSRSQMLSIAKEVALVLLYLHSHHPVPIIHGALNSHVVLLKEDGSTFKVTVTDAGLFPHFSQQVPAYAAPEQLDPQLHSTKLDIYSFGVLLIELYCRKALVSSSDEREKQIQHINWHELVIIIRSCLLNSSRPSIEHVLLKLSAVP